MIEELGWFRRKMVQLTLRKMGKRLSKAHENARPLYLCWNLSSLEIWYPPAWFAAGWIRRRISECLYEQGLPVAFRPMSGGDGWFIRHYFLMKLLIEVRSND